MLQIRVFCIYLDKVPQRTKRLGIKCFYFIISFIVIFEDAFMSLFVPGDLRMMEWNSTNILLERIYCISLKNGRPGNPSMNLLMGYYALMEFN